MLRVDETDQFRSWLDTLRDRTVRSRILVRTDRLAHPISGQHRGSGEGIVELKIDTGPGYRVYFVRRASRMILPAGGTKSTQQDDIALARRLARQLDPV
jgi:putative addiction module killer protein